MYIVFILSVKEMKKYPKQAWDMHGDMLKIAWDKIDSEHRRKAERYHNMEDTVRSIAGGLLIQYAIMQYQSGEIRYDLSRWIVLEYGNILQEILKVQELKYTYNKYGKPYLAERDIFFNISHSGDYVVCAVSNKEIGIDIQFLKDMKDMKLAKRFFSKEEVSCLESCSLEDRKFKFFEMWCKKEAYGKWLGTGLSEDVLQFEAKEDVVFEVKNLEEEYCIAVCQQFEK